MEDFQSHFFTLDQFTPQQDTSQKQSVEDLAKYQTLSTNSLSKKNQRLEEGAVRVGPTDAAQWSTARTSDPLRKSERVVVRAVPLKHPTTKVALRAPLQQKESCQEKQSDIPTGSASLNASDERMLRHLSKGWPSRPRLIEEGDISMEEK